MFPIAIDKDRLLTTGQNQLDNLGALAYSLFASVERLTELNLHTACAYVGHGRVVGESFGEIADLNTAYAASAELARPFLASGLAYARGVYEIAADSRQDLAYLFEGQLSQFNRELSESLDQVAGTVPEASEGAVTAVKIALATLNEAYEKLSAAGKETVEIIDAKVSAVADSLADATSADPQAADDETEQTAGKMAAKPRARKLQKEIAE